MKRCAKCRECKSATIENFGRNKNKSDGLNSWCKACMLNYRRANKEKVNAWSRKWREKNIERDEARKRAYYQANKDKIQAHNKSYYRANQKTVIEINKKWAEANEERVKINDATKRANQSARRHGETGVLIADDIRLLFEKYPHCLACGTQEGLSVDHVVPLSKGGKNTPDNLQVLCIICNVSKRTKTIDYRR